MNKFYGKTFLFLLLLSLSFVGSLQAQTNRNYTSGNSITVSLEGVSRPYVFTSRELLVNYNRQTQQLECILNLANLVPASDSLPATMAYEVLYGAKYPELYFTIDVPLEKVSAGTPYPQLLNSRVSIRMQGVTNETIAAIQFAPDENTLIFGTTINLALPDFKASIPARYLPLLTGRVGLTIQSARWTRPPSR